MEIRKVLNEESGGAGGTAMSYSVSGINDLASTIKTAKESTIDPAITSIYSTLDSMKSEAWDGPQFDEFKGKLDTYHTTIDEVLQSMIDKATGFTNIANEGEQTSTDVSSKISSLDV